MKKLPWKDIKIKLRDDNKIHISQRQIYRHHCNCLKKLNDYLSGTQVKPSPKLERKKFNEILTNWAALGDNKIDTFIDGLDDEEKNLIICKYKKHENWIKVAQKCYISDRQIYRRYNKILEKLKVFLENYKEAV